MIHPVIALFCGLLFGAGLTISKMVNPNKVLNFLDFTGNWDPSLLVVMLSALIVTFLGYRTILKFSQPLFAKQFYLPATEKIDSNLILGAAIFGTGWGIAGYCPGPAVVALGLGIKEVIYFLLSFCLTTVLYTQLESTKDEC